jgi:hypothetical protein
MLLMSCFFAGCFFRVPFLFFRAGALGFDLALGLLIPGILDISCWARAGKPATNRKVARISAQTLILKPSLIVLTFTKLPSRKLFRSTDVCQSDDGLSEKINFVRDLKRANARQSANTETPERA